ncbi:hypothetical protein DYB32_001230 [Aphanomyces invadans]|uniref:CCT domain-containing protein n=1 Tax=Aphanomyces invadans TaxID=157072 RepID=A0A418B754_9STRA|nr:hypothetical protein DYB32_001230 [Aphanomyces invadans]
MADSPPEKIPLTVAAPTTVSESIQIKKEPQGTTSTRKESIGWMSDDLMGMITHTPPAFSPGSLTLPSTKRNRSGSISGRLLSASDLEEKGFIDRYQKGVLKVVFATMLAVLRDKSLTSLSTGADGVKVKAEPSDGLLSTTRPIGIPGAARLNASAFLSGTLNTSAGGLSDAEKKAAFVGAYSPDSRRKRVEKFLDKRQKRVWRKEVKYDVRKNFADSRLRVKGRFVKKEDEQLLRELLSFT